MGWFGTMRATRLIGAELVPDECTDETGLDDLDQALVGAPIVNGVDGEKRVTLGRLRDSGTKSVAGVGGT
jgi:hypothetical protein